MTQHIILMVADEDPPDRVDRYLGTHAPELSRTRARSLIDQGLVTLNGERVKPSTLVSPGDLIEADVPESHGPSAEPEDIPLTVIYEDEDILVVDKPAGMVVHPAPGAPRGTLVNALLGWGVTLSSMGGTLRPGIVHRLDRETSGLIVVARNDMAHRFLGEAFHSRHVKKTYLALVWGLMREPDGVVDEPIGRKPADRKRMAVVASGRQAETAWRERERFPFASLIEASPLTGRTHQIRVHLSHLGRPVIGDRDYGGVKSGFGDVPPHYRRQASRVNRLADRQALHARELRFPHPSGEGEVRAVSPLPEDFGMLLSILRYPDGETGRVVGIDPGEARVGVAVSDEGRVLARPLPTISREDDSGVAARIAEICREEEARLVIVGQPLRMDGSVGPRAVRAREMAVAIEDACAVRVVLRDERWSSVEAERMMRETGETARGRKGRVDELAACVILQGYLDTAGAEGCAPDSHTRTDVDP
ncbi:MAG: Holliday junction resolvase RuvX [Candidatus Eisenbacteria bacterium]|nr:Holliday junction resolvase RuvX [Candidatus Eisenbacteria bacterium]